MNKTLLKYIPKFYKPFVKDIVKCDKEWNEYTKRWNIPIKVIWSVNGNEEEETFQNASYMYNLLKEFGGDIIDQMLWREKIL